MPRSMPIIGPCRAGGDIGLGGLVGAPFAFEVGFEVEAGFEVGGCGGAGGTDGAVQDFIASSFSGAGGFPPSARMRLRPPSSTPSSVRPMPGSAGGACTRATTAAARKQGAPLESCASSRTSVSTGRGCRVRMKNRFCRRSAP